MAVVDLGMDEEAERERERLERERLERRARTEAEARRISSGYLEEDPQRAALRELAGEPQRAPVPPYSPEAQERISTVEQRLRSGDRAGVERDAIRDMQGMRQEAVTSAAPAPMQRRAVGTGSDVGMELPEPSAAMRRPPSTQLRSQTWADAADAEPWWTTGDEPPAPGATLDVESRTLSRGTTPLRVTPPSLGATPPIDPRVTARPEPLRDPGLNTTSKRASTAPANPLDAGLPSENDISDARTRDAIRTPFRALGRALQAAGGMRPSSENRSEADVLQARRDAGMRERMAGKERARGEEAEAEAREVQLRDRDASRALDSRRLDLDERRLGMQEQEAQSEAGQRRRTLEDSVRERDMRRDPASPISEAARTTLRQRIATYRATGNAQLADSLERVYGPNFDRLTAEQLAPMLERTGGLPQVHMRGRAGGGGGDPAGRAARAEQLTALRAEAEAAGVPAAVARTADPEALQREIMARTRRGRGEEEGEEILPGVRATVALSPGEARGIRQGFSEMRSQMGALAEIERVAGQYGASAAIDRRAAGEMAAPVASLRAMVARLQNTGVINPSEAPAIEAMLPNPQSLTQMTFGDLSTRLRSFRGALERSVDAELDARGVSPEERQAALEMLRHGGQRRAPRQAEPAATAQSATVRVRLPDGRTGTIPRDRLERARAAGAEVIE